MKPYTRQNRTCMQQLWVYTLLWHFFINYLIFEMSANLIESLHYVSCTDGNNLVVLFVSKLFFIWGQKELKYLSFLILFNFFFIFILYA